MFIIKTPEQFRKDAQQVIFDLDGLVLAEGAKSMWRHSQQVRDNEAARALVKAYNTQDDKFPTIQASKEGTLVFDNGPHYIWVCDSPVIAPDGNAIVAIVVPAPRKVAEANVERQASDQTVKIPREEPKIWAQELKKGEVSTHSIKLSVGDIVQLDARERVAVQGGIGLIVIRYRVNSQSGHSLAGGSV